MATAAKLEPAMVRSGWALRAGLEHRWLTREHAVAWADRWIERLAEPPSALLELATPGRAATYDLIVMIRDVVGEPPARDRFALDVAVLHRRFVDGALSIFEAGLGLAHVWRREPEVLSKDAGAEVFGIEYACELTEDKIYGTPSDAAERFVRFAAPYTRAWADDLAQAATR